MLNKRRLGFQGVSRSYKSAKSLLLLNLQRSSQVTQIPAFFFVFVFLVVCQLVITLINGLNGYSSQGSLELSSLFCQMFVHWHDLTNKKTMTWTNTKTKTMTMTNTFRERPQREILEGGLFNTYAILHIYPCACAIYVSRLILECAAEYSDILCKYKWMPTPTSGGREVTNEKLEDNM